MIEQAAQQVGRALAPFGLDHCVERLQPFARLMRIGIPGIDAPERGGAEIGQAGHDDFLWQVRPRVYSRRWNRSDASAEFAAGACVMSCRIAAFSHIILDNWSLSAFYARREPQCRRLKNSRPAAGGRAHYQPIVEKRSPRRRR